MNIALIGYGKMGKIIERIALSRGHNISFRIDIDNQSELKDLNPGNTDAAIEFTHPGAAFENIKTCLEHRVKVISGTTGWLDRKPDIEKICKDNNGTFFHASNFSIGVNIFFRINEIIAGIMTNYTEYAVDITEIHHMEKKDAPSGTAIILAEKIIPFLKSKNGWISGTSGDDSKIPVGSIREGKVPGTHITRYKSETDEIVLKHEAYSREGFATGAIAVAEWIKDRTGLLEMKDFLSI